MKTILCKLGQWITLVGFCCMIWVGSSDCAMFVTIVALIAIIPGILFGIKAWDEDISPIGFLFMSKIDILDTKFFSAIIWGIRFFFLTNIIGLIFVLMIG